MTPCSAKRSVYRFAIARVLGNLSDILGLAGIVPLATSLGAFAPSRGSVAPLDLPVAVKVIVKEAFTTIILLLAEDTVLPKSAFSIFFNLKTALFVASLYADFSNTMAHDYFTGGCDGKT